MHISVNTALVQRIGLSDAIVLSYLWEESNSLDVSPSLDMEYPWVRASAPALATHLPCLSVYQIRRVCRRLVGQRLIRRAKRNAHPFDTTFSYQFTDVGIAIMQTCGEGCG